MRAWLAELYRRDRVLALAGAAHLAALGPALVAMLVDERSILGLDPWVKPARFLVSGALYLWRLAWLMPSVTGPRPPLPMTRPSTSRMGVTSAAVPVKKASSAM